jgi:protein-S-isoprenylcysteine O-methyltransferase Ste14
VSGGHLLLAVGLTLYAAVGIRLEERDLAARFGEAWAAYRARVGPFWPRIASARRRT